ncbi:hypothetical protein D9758_004578 [Tetrapyrgos nigripes]|uniref:Uncharacterized protein n=1 Tax=Tetrapyrgos nigripes TaxID=182062 RepID=A0A8H5H085_9AGAR|nr:hypothetical protein D9758_004578 [Tetrapyrgos nigripes]
MHTFQRLHRGSDPASPPVGVRASEHRRDTADSASQSRSRATSPLRILQQWSSGLHRTYTHHDDTDPFVPVNPFRSDFTFRLPNFGFFKNLRFTKASPSSDNEELSVFNVTTPGTMRHGTANVGSRRRDDGFSSLDRLRRRLHHIKDYLTETSISLLLVIYLHLLLRLPSMYFSRVSRIFEDAEISKPEIRRMINSCKGGSRIMAHNNRNATANAAASAQNQAQAQAQGTRSQPNLSNPNQTRPSSRTERERERPTSTSFAANLAAAGLGIASPFGPGRQSQPQTQTQTHLSPAAASLVDIVNGMDVDLDAVPLLPLPEEWSAQLVSPALMRFKMSWEGFVDSLMKEWKTLNVVSTLLLSAILTIFQVPDAATDPLTRTAALLSLISAIMSISYGCMYIVRFGAMRSMYRASRWAEEAQKTKTLLWWNVWILLAMPAVWMSWSMIFFITAIISYVWRTGSITDPPERDGLPPRAALGPRIAVTGLFVIGMVYFVLIVKTLRSYGSERPHTHTHSHRGGGRGGGGEGPGHSARRDGTGGWTSTQGRGYRAEHYDANANASVWERRGRERERSSSTARAGHRVRRSESLSRDHQHHHHHDHHHHHGNRLDFRERVHSLGHSYGHGLGLGLGGHGHGHEQGHSRKLFSLGTLMGHGHRDEQRAQVPAQAEGSRGASSDWVDLDAEMDLEKGLPSEKAINDGRDEKG